jgi:hypothetical protein
MAPTDVIRQVVRRPPWHLARPDQLLRAPLHPVDWLRDLYCTSVSYFLATPADGSASTDARDVYLGLRQAPCRKTRRLLIGQELRGFDGGGTPQTAFDQPLAGLAPRPALLEVDLKDFWSYFFVQDESEEEANGQPRPGRTASGGDGGWRYDHDETLFGVLEKHLTDQSTAGKKRVVGFCYHVGNPFNSRGTASDRQFTKPDGSLRALTAADLAQLSDTTTPAGQRWHRGLDRVAEIIREVTRRTPNVTVLFRPLHESNQDFFWWGRWGQPAFHALWQHTFEYLTETQGLHNLLWVYSATTKKDPENPLDDFPVHYPGDDLVDVVGMDVYSDTLENVDNWYGALHGLGKPVALTEYGPTRDEKGNVNGTDQSNSAVITAIRDRYRDLVWATCWYSDIPGTGNRFQINEKADPAALLKDDWSITIP